jgi:predicted neuraminidase
MTKNKPLELDGVILLPVYDEAKGGAFVLIGHGDSWRLVGDATSRHNALQPTLYRRSDGVLVLLSRTTRGRVWQSLSFDDGYSWTASQAISIPNPNSGIDAERVGDETILLACNDLQTGRERLSLYISSDEGKSWEKLMSTESQLEGEYSYPWLLQDDAQKVHLLYTVNRVDFCHITFDLGDIAGAELRDW